MASEPVVVAGPSEWVDAQAEQRQHPATFEAPSAADIQALCPGHHAKVCNDAERFWILISDVQKNPDPFKICFRGCVNSRLADSTKYDLGSYVMFEGRHVYNVIIT